MTTDLNFWAHEILRPCIFTFLDNLVLDYKIFGFFEFLHLFTSLCLFFFILISKENTLHFNVIILNLSTLILFLIKRHEEFDLLISIDYWGFKTRLISSRMLNSSHRFFFKHLRKKEKSRVKSMEKTNRRYSL